jgi:hypothetical protein
MVGRRATWCSFCQADWELRRSKPEAREKLECRFKDKFDEEPGCWIWTAAMSNTGYGSIGVEGKTCHAHRIAYELWVGPIPEGAQIDHLCRERACVNPAHLEVVSAQENAKRGLNGVLKTRCAQGHPWTEEHIYHRPGSGKKMCGTCNRERSRARHRAADDEPPTP